MEKMAHYLDDDIVITGISGRFPNADSVEELQEKLLAGVDMITDEPRRFQSGIHGALTKYGLIYDLSRFDSEFFKIHPKQAERMDPQVRMLLEVTYETIVDAGMHPDDLKGSRTGIVVGVASSETQDRWSQRPDQINGYEYVGCTRTMFANRVSQMFDLKGPSYSIDTASSTTMVAFAQAYWMIKDGICDSCFVAGTDLVLNPSVCIMFQCLNMLSPEGRCKAFDSSGDGYVRSEGAIACLLQKAKTAKRVYAKVLGAGSNCDGYKDDGITFPSREMQAKLFRQVVKEAGIDATKLDFLEAHGSATKVGDPQEMNAVTEVFVDGRCKPLLTGSIKSNLGHAEPASALSAVVKMCIAMECGILPPNLHFHNPNPDIPAILDGRLQVVTKPTAWNGGLVGINSFGVGGANGHVILDSHKKVTQYPSDAFPRLICVSGVTENAIKTMFNKITATSPNVELYALLNNIYRKNIEGHNWRGFSLLSNENSSIIMQDINKRASKAPRLCCLFTGFASHFPGMGHQLLDIPAYRETMDNITKILKSLGSNINLYQPITRETCENDILTSCVVMTATQIGLFETLKGCGITPDYLIGINNGTISVGYADGIYSLEQAIIMAYRLGEIFSQLPKLEMVVINAPWKSDKYTRPNDVYIACKMTENLTLFAGSKNPLRKFAKELEQKGYKCTDVLSGGVGFGSFDNLTVQKVKKMIQQVLGGNFKMRNNSRQAHLLVDSNAGDYIDGMVDRLLFADNIDDLLLAMDSSTVMLKLGSISSSDTSLIPKKLYGKASIYLHSQECSSIVDFLTGIGRLYLLGHNPQISALYSEVKFPVSHGTPKIQSMIEWDHSVKWDVVSFAVKGPTTSGEITTVVDFSKEEFSFLPGSQFNERSVFPKSFYIVLVWKSLSKRQIKPIEDIPIVMESICFLQDAIIPEDGTVLFAVNLLSDSTKFEIWEMKNNVMIAFGRVRIAGDIIKEHIPQSFRESFQIDGNFQDTNKSDIYEELSLKHYRYSDAFKGLNSYNIKNECGTAEWTDNWTTFMESLLQIPILELTNADDKYPSISHIRKIVINPSKHLECLKTESASNKVVVERLKKLNVMKCGGVEIHGICMTSVTLNEHDKRGQLTKFSRFIPFFQHTKYALEASLQMAFENCLGINDITISEIGSGKSVESLLSVKLMKLNAHIQMNVTIYSITPELFECDGSRSVFKDISTAPLEKSAQIIFATDVATKQPVLENLRNSLQDGGCILLHEKTHVSDAKFSDSGLQCVSTLSDEHGVYVLLKKVPPSSQLEPVIINSAGYDWLAKLKNSVKKHNSNIVIVAQRLGILDMNGFMKTIYEETKPSLSRISLVIIDDETAPDFSMALDLYKKQLQLDFPLNVIKNGKWGCYVNLNISVDAKIQTECATISSNLNYVQDDPYKRQPEAGKYFTHAAAFNDIDNKKNLFTLESSNKEVDQDGLLSSVEFSGIDCKSKCRVFGFACEQSSALSTIVIGDDILRWNIPDQWTFQQASTIPYAYAMAYYGIACGQLQSADYVVVIGHNSAAQAAINIAIRRNMKLLVIVHSVEMRSTLLRNYSRLNESQVLISNGDSLYLDILEKTGSKKVKCILDFNRATSKSFLQAYLQVIDPNGSIITLEEDIPVDDSLGSALNMQLCTFHRITPRKIIYSSNHALRSSIYQMILEGIENHEVQPLPFVQYSDSNVDSAISYAADNLMQEKIIIAIRDTMSYEKKVVDAHPMMYFNGTKSYIIRGGLNGVGLQVTNWMVVKGARNLVIINEEKMETGSSYLYTENWTNIGAKIRIVDVSNLDQAKCKDLIAVAGSLAPLEGIFDFSDYRFKNSNQFSELSDSSMAKVASEKLSFAENMDKLTSKMNLRFFIVFDEAAHGNCLPAYSVYNFINSQLCALVRSRESRSLAGTLINWGPIEIGSGSKNAEFEKRIFNMYKPMRIACCLKTYGSILQLPYAIVSSFVPNDRRDAGAISQTDLIINGVAKFLEIKNLTSEMEELTLLDLGMDSLISTDIQNYLALSCNLIVTDQHLRMHTFCTLRQQIESST